MNNEDTNKLIQVGTLDKPEWIEARRRVYSPDGICPTLNGIGQGGNTEPKIIVVGRLDIKGKDQIRRVYDPEGLAPTLSTMQGGATAAESHNLRLNRYSILSFQKQIAKNT